MPRMSARRWSLVLIACSCLWGCRLRPVNTPSFADDSAVRRIDPNHGPFLLRETNTPDPRTGHMHLERIIEWKDTTVRPDLRGARTLVMKYRCLDFPLFSRVSVRIRLGDRRKYWALMDSGYPGSLYVNDMVVRDCDLAVFPLGEDSDTGCPQGICAVPTLRIGQATVKNPPCLYAQRQWQLRVLGQPLYRNRAVLIGLGFMRFFPYVLFDNVRREVVVGLHDAFEPKDPSEWVSVPFVLEKTEGGSRVVLDISLSGRKTRVVFDTGGAKPGLLLRDAVWQDLGGAPGAATRCALYEFGWLPCRRVIVPELRVGPLILKRGKAKVLSQNISPLENSEGILSLDYFKKTRVVLDFTRNLLWIGK